MKTDSHETGHDACGTLWDAPIDIGETCEACPESSSPNRVPRIEFGAGRGRLGQAIPNCGAGQVMAY